MKKQQASQKYNELRQKLYNLRLQQILLPPQTKEKQFLELEQEIYQVINEMKNEVQKTITEEKGGRRK